jgi:hypothetical protein
MKTRHEDGGENDKGAMIAAEMELPVRRCYQQLVPRRQSRVLVHTLATLLLLTVNVLLPVGASDDATSDDTPSDDTPSDAATSDESGFLPPRPRQWFAPPCTTKPQPCPGHASRTFCATDPAPHQCDAPPRKTQCPPCPKPRAPGCKTEEDCSLGGLCVGGLCKCDATWTGPHCVQLNLLPANKSAHGYQRGSNFGIDTIPNVPNQSFASWGGQAVYEDGMYHLVFADFEECGLGCWGTSSQLARAVSQSPLGPYKKVEVIVPPFHHNPTFNKVPGGGPFVITSIGCAPLGGNGSVTNCSSWLPPGHWPPPSPSPEHARLRGAAGVGVGDPSAAGVITMIYSDKVTGPWKQHPGVILEPAALDKWDSFVTNPSLYFYTK